MFEYDLVDLRVGWFGFGFVIFTCLGWFCLYDCLFDWFVLFWGLLCVLLVWLFLLISSLGLWDLTSCVGFVDCVYLLWCFICFL